MLDLIVLGQLPGTNIRLGFIPIMIMFEIGFVFYLLKKYHSDKLRKIMKELKKLEKKAYKRLKPYEKRLEKKLVHLWHDVFGPKLKFLK